MDYLKNAIIYILSAIAIFGAANKFYNDFQALIDEHNKEKLKKFLFLFFVTILIVIFVNYTPIIVDPPNNDEPNGPMIIDITGKYTGYLIDITGRRILTFLYVSDEIENDSLRITLMNDYTLSLKAKYDINRGTIDFDSIGFGIIKSSDQLILLESIEKNKMTWRFTKPH